MVVSTESEFEEKVIQALQSKGWEKEVLRYPTEQDLIDNWAQILFENNRQVDRLGDAPLTDTEWRKFLNRLKNYVRHFASMVSSTVKLYPSPEIIRTILHI